MPLDQPYRGATADRDAANRPRGIALPPEPLPMLHAGRLRKRWRYVGVFGPELSLCVGHVRVGPFQQTFWATWERETGRLRERTYRRAAGVQLPPGRVIVRDGGVKIDLEFAEDPDGRDPGRIETVTPYGSGYAWTAKRGAVPIAGTIELDDVVHPIDALAMVDDSGGYPRATPPGTGRRESGRTASTGRSPGTSSPGSTTIRGRASARSGSTGSPSRSIRSRSPRTSPPSTVPASRSASPARRPAAATRTCCSSAAATSSRSGTSAASSPAA